MKVTISNEEIKLLANMIVMSSRPMPIPPEPDDGWLRWITAPIAQHDIAPREVRALLTAVGTLANYSIPVSEMINSLLETFVANYKNQIGSGQSQSPLKRQNYSCNICGLKSFVIYNPKGDAFDVVIKIGKDHKEREPTCPCPLDDLNMIGEPTEI